MKENRLKKFWSKELLTRSLQPQCSYSSDIFGIFLDIERKSFFKKLMNL